MQEKIENALNESRILLLVTEVIIGFQYQSVFQKGFTKLPISSQYLRLIGLGAMLIALGLLMAPVAYHRIVEHGELTPRFHRFISSVMCPALLPFALGLSFDCYIVTEKILTRAAGIIASITVGSIALFFWYGLELLHRPRREDKIAERDVRGSDMPKQNTPLQEKIKFVLMDARVVLPGAQALLGFQFAAVLTDGFDTLAVPLKYWHLTSLGFVALCTICLMAPAAYHRIVENGENTERLHRFASRMVLASMALLALGISGDVYVVVAKILNSPEWAALTASLTLLLFFGFWFAYMFYKRAENTLSTSKTLPARM